MDDPHAGDGKTAIRRQADITLQWERGISLPDDATYRVCLQDWARWPARLAHDC